MSKASRWLVVLAVAPMALASLYALFIVMVAFSAGSASAFITLQTSVYDKETKAVVPDCLLTLSGVRRPRRANARTDANGRIRERSAGMHSWSTSLFLEPFQRERDPALDLYLGDPPDGSQVGELHVGLRFREPLISDHEVVPLIDSPQAPAEAVVRFGSQEHQSVYRVLLSLYLDKSQIAACQAKPFDELSERGR